MMNNLINIGIPSKGRLKKDVLKIFYKFLNIFEFIKNRRVLFLYNYLPIFHQNILREPY